jgi:hypothetical protein
MTDSSKILVRRIDSSEDWTAPESQSYDREDHLQQVVATSPHWVPGVPEGAFSVREFHTVAVAGRVDVVIIDPPPVPGAQATPSPQRHHLGWGW